MTAIGWKDPRCVVCLGTAELTLEHIIPDSLGGILTSRFLCKGCNSRFGSGFEAKARLSPELRRAALDVKECAELAKKLEIGAGFVQDFGGEVVESILRKDGSLGTAQLADGSIVVPEESAAQKIRSMLSKNGATLAEINAAISAWEDSLEDEIVDLGAGIATKKWSDVPARPAYEESALSPLLPLKIAFEFLALIAGGAIYSEVAGFQSIRRALFEQDEAFARRIVQPGLAQRPEPFHGIALRGNEPDARVQVRLFGFLAYTVRFPGVAINQDLIVYTHRLDTHEDWVHVSKTAE